MNHSEPVKISYLKELLPLNQTIEKGASGSEVKKIVEWLRLWQLNENQVDLLVKNEDHFDETVERLVQEIQAFFGLPVTGAVDQVTWDRLVDPLRQAFSTEHYCYTTVREKMIYFALKHLQFRASELGKRNAGPWVRSYMDGQDDGQAHWCQGFVCTILDQTFASSGQRFDSFYANTLCCEQARQHGHENGLLISNHDLTSGEYDPQPGDMVLYLQTKGDRAHHTEIVYDILDIESGAMRTIGGNTHFSGNHNGMGVYMVDRNFLDQNVEIVKLINRDI